MSDDVPQPSKARLVRLRTAVVCAVVIAAAVGAGASFVGFQVGERQPTGPSADFIYQQQAAAAGQLKDTTSQLVAIEQNSAELLTSKSGAEVDAVAFYRLRTQYTHVYNAVLGEMGRINSLFDPPVPAAAKQVSHSDNVALSTLYPEQGMLASLSAAQIHAIVVNSHTARKGQWAAVRKFYKLATAQMLAGS